MMTPAGANAAVSASTMAVVPVPGTEEPEKKKCLDLRARIVLDVAGAQFFQKRQARLQCFEGAEGEPRFGFRLRTIDVPWLKRLLHSGFVDKAEFPVREIAGVKTALNDLSRLVVYSMIYGRFKSAVIARAVDTEVIRRWNRMHPNKSLDAHNAVSPQELRQAMAARAEAIDGIKREILAPVQRSLAVGQKRSPEDQRKLAAFAWDLLGSLDPLVFFVLLGSDGEARKKIISDIAREVLSSIEKSDLADYLTLMVLELMSAAERTTLLGIIGPDIPPSEIRSQLENPVKRRELLAKLPNGLASAMVWSLARRWSLGRWRYRLRVSLHDGSSSFEDSKRLFEERGRLSLGDRSLKEFYDHGSGPYGDDGMGWYYLSFLAEACEKMGINFEASVRERPGSGTAAVNLVFVF